MKKLFSDRTIILATTLLIHLSASHFQAHAAAGDVDLSFNPGGGVNGPVKAVAVQSDGKVLIGGPLTFINGTNRYGSARLNADGSADTTFIPTSFDPAVGDLGVPHDPASAADSITLTAFALQPDGKVIVAGVATRWHCTEESGCTNPDYFFFVTRHHPNGSRDTSFAPALGNQIYGGIESVSALAVQSNGKVLVGGYFKAINGTNRNGIARLNANGTVDTSSSLNISSDYNFRVTALATQPDGKFFIEGARFNDDGAPDGSFSAVGGVVSVLLQPDGKVLIGGGFVSVQGTNRNHIARLHPNGSLDLSFDPGTGANSTVRSIALQSGGDIVLGGDFTQVNETNRNHVARLNADGSLDAGFDPGPGLEPAPRTLALQPDGKVLLGGPMATGVTWWAPLSDTLAFVNGTNQCGRIRLNANGTMDRGFIPSPFYPLLTAMYHPEDCLNLPGFGCDQGAVTTALLVQSNGKVLIGGYSAATVTGDETLYQVYRPFLARFNANSSLETKFDYLTNAYEVTALAQQPDGKILIGGGFFRGGSNYCVARLHADGSVDDSFQVGQGPNFTYNERVYCFALQFDGKLLVGGNFGLLRLNSNGIRDATFNPALNSAVNALAVQPDGRVVLGGSFSLVNGVFRNRIARLNGDGSLDSQFNPSAGPDGVVTSIVLQPDGNVIMGGDFTTVNGAVRSYVARLQGADVPPALKIAKSNSAVTIAWPSTSGFVLEQSLTTTGIWSQVGFPYVTNGNLISITTQTESGKKFYRLRKL